MYVVVIVWMCGVVVVHQVVVYQGGRVRGLGVDGPVQMCIPIVPMLLCCPVWGMCVYMGHVCCCAMQCIYILVGAQIHTCTHKKQYNQIVQLQIIQLHTKAQDT